MVSFRSAPTEELQEEAGEVVAWAKKHVDPRLILIHNRVKEIGCKAPDGGQPSGSTVECAPHNGGQWHPELPRRAYVLDVFADTLGPAVTALHAGGLHAGRQRADGLTCQVLNDLRARLGYTDDKSVLRLALDDDKQSYPLGWYLSRDGPADQEIGARFRFVR